MPHDDLPRIAQLLKERNRIDKQIAAITERPMTSGHLGEWIAAEVFDIELEKSATTTAFDGRFGPGPLQGRTVNVKWCLKREGILDMTTSEALDYYLVMAGPVSAAVSSHGRTRPWCIVGVYLFDAHGLRDDLVNRGRSVGTASSIRTELWNQAEIYPQPVNTRMSLTDRQVEALQLFAPLKARVDVAVPGRRGASGLGNEFRSLRSPCAVKRGRGASTGLALLLLGNPAVEVRTPVHDPPSETEPRRP